MIKKLYQQEQNKDLLEDYKKADKFMLNLMFVHWVLVSTVSAYFYNTYFLGIIGGGMLFLITYIAYKQYSGTPIYRIIISISIMTFTIIAIQQNLGRIEFHFHVFIALSFLTVYKDLKPATIASVYIAIHHILFTYLQLHSISIFDTQIMVFNYGCGYDIAILHAVFVIFEWIVLYKIITTNKNDFNKINEYKNQLQDTNKILNEKTKEQNQLLSLFDEGDSVLFKWNNDNQWSVNSVSTSVSKLLGYEQKDFINHEIGYASCIHEDDIYRVRKEVSDAGKILDSDFFKHQPYRVITKNKDIRWVLDYTIIVRDNKNSIKEYIGHVSDITDLRKNEEQILKSEKLASMGEMIGNIAHQWRQPLSAISAAATGIKIEKEYGYLTDEGFYKSCDAINNNAQYLSKTIDDFRNFIKGDRSKTLFSLKDEVNSFLHLVEGSIKNHNIEMILDLKDDIKIDGYENELTQCLINIFNNAKDELKEKDMENKFIFISTSKNNSNAIIKVKDNAGGIPDDIIHKVFEPYFTTKHQSQGTGLGLHMAYNLIVDGMVGTIQVNNKSYEYDNIKYFGAEFIIELPLS
jgi:PAS domain S-box-containing protein